MLDKTRCFWCTADLEYIAYHDNEWGIPNYDAQYLFEFLILEGFQAGLSWLTVLKKRERYREVLFNFNPDLLANMKDAYIEQLMLDKGIIRNRLKLNAARKNAQAWLKLTDPVDFLWSFVGHRPQLVDIDQESDYPTTSPESDAMSKALKKAGFSFVGSTICYAYMQAVGMISAHTSVCFAYHQNVSN